MVIIDGPGGLPTGRLVWLITYGPPLRYMGLYETGVRTVYLDPGGGGVSAENDSMGGFTFFRWPNF